jgi:hypothetical protein
MSDADADRVRGTASGFKRKLFRSAQEQADYLRSGAGERSQEQRDAIATYTGGSARDLNQALRTKKTLPPEQSATAEEIRSAMQPTADDLVLTRTVPLAAFGDAPIEELAGKKVKDAGFTSASLGLAHGGRRDNVTIQISVPKGTPALFVGDDGANPGDREVILPDAMEFAVASATKNDRGGYDLHLVALPKEQAPKDAGPAPRKMSDRDLEQAMNDALEAEDFDRFDELATETDRRDQAKAAAKERKLAEREAREQAQAEEFDRLLSGGWDEESAVEKAYGVPVEKQRRDRAIAMLRDGGYSGKSFDQLSRAAFRDHVYQQWLDAEDATNGYMLNRKAKARGVDPKSLFAGPERVARANASDELLEWWDENGRTTLEEFRADLLGDTGAARTIRAGRGDFLA